MRPALSAADGAPSESSLTTALLTAIDSGDLDARRVAIADAATFADPEALVALVADHSNSARRNAAMQALAQGGARSVPTLVRALKHDDPEVVLFATNILGRTRHRSAIGHLVPLVDHADVNVAQAAVESLASLRASVAVDALVRALRRDPWLQFAAVHALGEIGDPRAVPALAELLSEESVRETVITALGRIGSPKALEVLAAHIREYVDTDAFVDCLRAIGELLEAQPNERPLRSVTAWVELGAWAGSQVQERLHGILVGTEPTTSNAEEGLEIRRAVASIVRALKIRSLYTALVLAGETPEMRERLRFCAASLGMDMGPALIAELANANTTVRAFAAECVGAVAIHSAAPRLQGLLSDPEPTVRAAAVEALGHLQFIAAIPAMVALLEDEDRIVGDAAVTALSLLDAEAVTRAMLEERLEDPVARRRALAVCAANPNEGQHAIVLESLRHKDGGVRAAAVSALGALRAGDTVALLEPLLADAVVEVRCACVEVLGACRDRRVRAILVGQLGRDEATRESTVRALANLGDPLTVGTLTELIATTHGNVRAAAIEALARVEHAAAEPVLVNLLTSAELSARLAAVNALATNPSATALRYLVSGARDPHPAVRAAVARALRFHDDPVAVGALDRLRLDHDAVVAATASAVLPSATSTRSLESKRPTLPVGPADIERLASRTMSFSR